MRPEVKHSSLHEVKIERLHQQAVFESFLMGNLLSFTAANQVLPFK